MYVSVIGLKFPNSIRTNKKVICLVQRWLLKNYRLYFPNGMCIEYVMKYSIGIHDFSKDTGWFNISSLVYTL